MKRKNLVKPLSRVEWRERALLLEGMLKMCSHQLEYWRGRCKIAEGKKKWHLTYGTYDLRSIKAQRKAK